MALFKQLDELGGVDTNYPCVVLYSDDKATAAPVHHYLTQNLMLEGVRTCQIGPTIGTHIGPPLGGHRLCGQGNRLICNTKAPRTGPRGFLCGKIQDSSL